MDPISIRHRVRELVGPTIERLGFDLVAVEWSGTHTGRVLRLSIDGPGGVTIANCTEVSHRAAPILDADDPIKGRYRLEVSSPGIERPVQRPDDFKRLAGYRIRLRLFEGHPRRRFSGELRGMDGDDVIVIVDEQEQRIHFESIERAHLELDLDDYQRLGDMLYRAEPLQE